ncbi:hypothetical protein NP233_g5921 [Leucocoprinus birnbaumii]|uniref:F-box domain-containing protein n=1 Tax=Leucocoprinus birnbaumii TaxID=56174 RepID=A0AAD5VRZ9_9AGAR|nr:hypothetical protein NP233_g5921 [Leucocoprinus birnbaumii]
MDGSNINCLYCDRPYDNSVSPSIPLLNHQGPSAEADTINKRLSQIQHLTTQLLKERHDLLLRLNSIQPLTRSLPSEVLALIFEEASREPPGTSVRVLKSRIPTGLAQTLLIGAVSTQWRTIIYSTPQLWTNLRICLDPVKFKNQMSIMMRCLSMSKSFPLNVALDFNELKLPVRYGSSEDYLIAPSIDTILRKNLSRVQRLQLWNPPQRWFRDISSLANLEELTIERSRSRIRRLSLDNASFLLKLTLTRLNCTRINLPSSTNLTHVTLFGVHLNVATNILLHSPRLIDLQCFMLEGNVKQSELTKATVLGQLNTLTWHGIESKDWRVIFLHKIQLTALESLRWSINQDAKGDMGYLLALQTFFSRLISLKSLILERFMTQDVQLRFQALMFPPLLEHLTLRNWLPSHVIAFLEFEVLVEHGDAKESHPLSHLRTLTVDIGYYSASLPDHLLEILNVLKRRPAPVSLVIYLDLNSLSGKELSSESVELLKDQVSQLEGKLKLTMDGKKVL